MILINEKGRKKRFYDFSKVYLFEGLSKRGGDKSALNIYVATTLYEVNKKWRKNKLRLGIIGHENSDELWEALKHLNELLLEKDRKR